MARITYVLSDGSKKIVDVAEGISLKDGAVDNDISGIVAECGGAAACGTCQVRVDDAWVSRVPAATNLELSIISDDEPNRRLSCQIKSGPELDGLVVHVPASQY